MNTLTFSCPHCQQHVECDTSYGGTEIQCPICTGLLLVPPAAEAAAADTGSPVLNIDYRRPELQGFDDYYLREIEPQMASRKVQQRTARLWCALVLPLGTILTAAASWWLFGRYGLEWWTFMIVGVLAAVTGILAFEKLFSLQSGVKGFLLLQLCNFFGIEYSERVKDVGFQDFDNSGLLPYYNEMDLEDRFTGNHNGVEFDFFECKLEVEKGSGDDRKIKKVYHGVLFRFAFTKQFSGRTLVLKDAGAIGNFFKNRKVSGQRIKLEDPRFEKLFEVWGDDQIEARYLLTPTFMERMVELAEAIHSSRIEFAFINNLLLVSAHVSQNQFEGGGLFTNVADKRRVEKLVNEVCRVFDIVNTLQLALKTRI